MARGALTLALTSAADILTLHHTAAPSWRCCDALHLRIDTRLASVHAWLRRGRGATPASASHSAGVMASPAEALAQHLAPGTPWWRRVSAAAAAHSPLAEGWVAGVLDSVRRLSRGFASLECCKR